MKKQACWAVAALALAACSSDDSSNPGSGGGAGADGGAGTGGMAGTSGSGGSAGTGGSAGAATGHIRIDPAYPHSFVYDGGARYFPMGDTAYELLGESDAAIHQFLDSRAAHSFNLVRIGAIAPGFWPFGGTPASPDFGTVDEAKMQKLDATFDYAKSVGVNIELIVWLYDAEGGNGMWGNTAQENQWVDTLVGRYKDRTNLFMWTVTNEFERYPTAAYSYEESDVDWAKSVAARIHGIDPIHAIGAHPSVWISEFPPHGSFHSYKGTAQHLPQVVWPLWEQSAISVLNVQNNQGVQPGYWNNGVTYESTDWQGSTYPVTWTSEGWDMEGPGMEDSVAEDWSHGKPVINTEFGYQFEAGASGFGVTTKQLHSPASVRRKAWKITTAGGYFCMGFAHTAVQFDATNIETWRPAQLETLYDFFTQNTQYWKMAPHLELVDDESSLLALPGEEYVAYFPRGGTRDVTLEAGSYTAAWLNPATGDLLAADMVTSTGGKASFACPASGDWVLHLKKTP